MNNQSEFTEEFLRYFPAKHGFSSQDLGMQYIKFCSYIDKSRELVQALCFKYDVEYEILFSDSEDIESHYKQNALNTLVTMSTDKFFDYRRAFALNTINLLQGIVDHFPLASTMLNLPKTIYNIAIQIEAITLNQPSPLNGLISQADEIQDTSSPFKLSNLDLN